MPTKLTNVERRKQLLRQLNEATDPDERDKIATKIIRLTSKPRGRRKPRGWKPAAKIGADPKEVQKQQRAVALANEKENEVTDLTFDIRTLGIPSLEALKNDPAVNEDGVDAITKEIESRAGDEGDEGGEEIAASFGRGVPSDSFVKSCERRYAEEKRATASR